MLIVPTRRHDGQGFTLIELMVGIAIVGLLLTQALPSFTTWLRNLQIRNSAEAILNGLQLAKAQAVRSNNSTGLVLIAAGIDPDPANVDADAVDTLGPSPWTNPNWIVRTPTANAALDCPEQLPAGMPFCFVQGRSGREGTNNALITATQASFIFTPLGRLLNPPPADVLITVNSADAFAGQRRMCIVVSTGGQVRMCDPNGVDATNPQFCLPVEVCL